MPRRSCLQSTTNTPFGEARAGSCSFLVGGTGAREEVFAQLYGAVGVARPDAIVASLLVYLVQLAIGLVGAVIPMPKAGAGAPWVVPPTAS